jgi:prepilin-type processing-associated H-X9-DG protein
LHTMKKILTAILAMSLMISCSKELSEENGGGNQLPPVGNNCKLSQITDIDSVSKEGLYSIFTRFNTSGQGTRVEFYDSILQASQFEANLSYSGDTIRISPIEYFLKDASGRVKEYRVIEFDGVDLDTLTFRYTYDGSGYMSKKELFDGNIPVPLFRFTYTWQNGNMVYVDGSVAISGLTQKILTASLEYDGATAKNFIPIFPDGFETSPYIMALNLGTASRNLPKRITLTFFNEAGNPDEVYETRYGSFLFSSDGYLTEWTVTGAEAGGMPFSEGRQRFSYFCR